MTKEILRPGSIAYARLSPAQNRSPRSSDPLSLRSTPLCPSRSSSQGFCFSNCSISTVKSNTNALQFPTLSPLNQPPILRSTLSRFQYISLPPSLSIYIFISLQFLIYIYIYITTSNSSSWDHSVIDGKDKTWQERPRFLHYQRHKQSRQT